MGDTSSTMNARFIAALFVAAVAVAAAGEMDQYNTDVAFAEATSFVQSYLEAQVFEGKTKDESACEKVADDSINEIINECKKLQGMVNSAATKNAHCCKDSMGPVRKAVSRYNKSKSDRKQCDRELESLRNSNVSFSGVKFKYLKEGKCGNFFTGGSFRSVHNKVKAKTKRCDIMKGQTKAYKRQWDTAVAQACRGRDKCNARAKTAYDNAFRTATRTCQSAKNKKAWTRAKHLKCVLKGQTLSQCRVGSVPKIQPRTMTKRKCNCQCHSINNDVNHVANDSVHGVSRTIVGHTPTDVRRNRFMGYFNTHRNFKMQFSIKPHSRRGGWQNILHFTANNQNYGSHGSRIPAIWFYGSSTRMHIRMGRPHHTNDGCDPGKQLPLGKWTRVSVVLRGRTLSVDYDGKRVCTTNNYYHRDNGRSRVRLYMADPWYTEADASIRDFTYGKADYGATGKCDGSVDAPTKPKRPTGKKDFCGQVCASRKEELLLQEQEGLPAGWVNKFTIQERGLGKEGSSLIPHPGYTVNIVYRVGSKGRDTTKGLAIWYPAPKYKLTQINSISGGIPKGTHVFYDILPQGNYGSQDIQAMKNFLDTGGRAILTGENNGYAPQENARISSVVAALGGGVQIEKSVISVPVFDAKHMNRLPVTSGVGKFATAAWASLAVKRSVADIVMAEGHRRSHHGKIFCADQILRKGRLTVWADKNNFQSDRSYGKTKDARNPQSDFPRNLAHQAANFVQQVKKGVDPNAAAKKNKKKEVACQCRL